MMRASHRPAVLRYYPAGKRVLDVAVTGVALLASAPVQALVAAAVRTNLGSPVLFRQERAGKDGRIFTLYKFRTMRDVDPERDLITDEQRLTGFGKFLRSTSLDELPSLWNILTGDMSLVGPRPLLVRYLDRYTPEQAERHRVRPGLTGLAQVNGRNATTWEERFNYDRAYVRNITLLGDLKIIGRTFTTVLKRDGISAEGNATMPEFGIE